MAGSKAGHGEGAKAQKKTLRSIKENGGPQGPPLPQLLLD